MMWGSATSAAAPRREAESRREMKGKTTRAVRRFTDMAVWMPSNTGARRNRLIPPSSARRVRLPSTGSFALSRYGATGPVATRLSQPRRMVRRSSLDCWSARRRETRAVRHWPFRNPDRPEGPSGQHAARTFQRPGHIPDIGIRTVATPSPPVLMFNQRRSSHQLRRAPPARKMPKGYWQ